VTESVGLRHPRTFLGREQESSACVVGCLLAINQRGVSKRENQISKVFMLSFWA